MEFNRKPTKPKSRGETLLTQSLDRNKNKHFHKFAEIDPWHTVQNRTKFKPDIKTYAGAKRSLQFTNNLKVKRTILQNCENKSNVRSGFKPLSPLASSKRPLILPKPIPGSCPPKIKQVDLTDSSIFDSDDDDEIYLNHKHDTKQNNDKENKVTSIKLSQPPKITTSISPEKAETAKEISDYTPSSPLTVGFANYGNTCYVNSVLQVLIQLQPFMNDIRRSLDGRGKSSRPVSRSLCNVADAKAELDLVALMTNLREFKESVEEVDPSFSGCRMHDSSEFLTRLLDIISDEAKEAKEKEATPTTSNKKVSPTKCVLRTPKSGSPQISDVKKESESPSSILMTPDSISPLTPEITILDSSDMNERELQDDNCLSHKQNSSTIEKSQSNLLSDPVIRNFGFELFESYACLGCGVVKGRNEAHSALFVNLPKEEESECSVQSCVDAYFKEDQRERKCDECGQGNSRFLVKFARYPRFLIVTLKRFEFCADNSRSLKVSTNVAVSLSLRLGHFSIEDAEGPSVVFNDPNRNNDKSATVSSTPERNSLNHSSSKASSLTPEEAIAEKFSYKLVAIINHLGTTTFAGHYVCDVFDSGGNCWRNYNDETVNQVQMSQILGETRRCNGYVFVYRLSHLEES